MKTKLLIALLVVTLGTVYASNNMSFTKTKDFKKMSTTELQIEVERLSAKNKLPFEMGLELMNRWTETKKEVN
jgi:hypothetical protein